jgi:hypothetical protein
MKFVCSLIFIWLSSLTIFADDKVLIDYSEADSLKVVNLLEAVKLIGSNEPLPVFFGKQLLGVPYVSSTLEIGGYERLIVNLRQLDCTTFVENVTALSVCARENYSSFSDYCRILKKLRYWGGEIKNYTSRLHYFSWWGLDNQKKGFITEVSCGDSLFSATQVLSVDYMTKNSHLYKHLSSNAFYRDSIRNYENLYNGLKFSFLPKNRLKNSKDIISKIRSGDIIAIVTNKKGLDISHVGIAIWIKGKLHLMHASSLKKKVIIDDLTLYDYSMKQKSNLGIRVFRIVGF